MLDHPLYKLIKNAVIYGLGQILSRFMGFLLLPLFTAYLSPKDYGVIAILNVMNLVVTSIFSLGFGAATGLCYFASDDPFRKADTIWTSVFILAMSVLAMSLTAIVIPHHISEVLFHTSVHAHLVTLSLLSAGTIILNSQFMLHLMFEQRAVLYVVITTIITMLSLGLSLLTVVFLGKGVAGVIESLLIANIVGFVLLIIPTVRDLPLRLNRAIARELFRFGIPLIPSALFIFMLQQGNQYILERLRGLDEVGVYVIGFNFGIVMNYLVSAFTTSWYPHFMSYMDRQGEVQNTFGRIATAYIIGIGAASLVFYAMAKPLITTMTQPPFHAAYKVVGMAATAFTLSGFFSVLLPAVYFAKEVKYITVIQGAAALIALLLNLVLIPLLGMTGAALALLLGHFAMVALQYAWNHYRRRDYLQIQYEWKRIFRFCVFYLVFASFTLWPRQLSLAYEMVLSGFFTFVLLFALFMSLTVSEKRFLYSMLHQFKSQTFFA